MTGRPFLGFQGIRADMLCQPYNTAGIRPRAFPRPESPMPRKLIQTRADLIAFYVRQAYEQASWAGPVRRSEEHTSELQSLMRISYAVFCLKKKNISTSENTQKKNTSTVLP